MIDLLLDLAQPWVYQSNQKHIKIGSMKWAWSIIISTGMFCCITKHNDRGDFYWILGEKLFEGQKVPLKFSRHLMAYAMMCHLVADMMKNFIQHILYLLNFSQSL